MHYNEQNNLDAPQIQAKSEPDDLPKLSDHQQALA